MAIRPTIGHSIGFTTTCDECGWNGPNFEIWQELVSEAEIFVIHHCVLYEIAE